MGKKHRRNDAVSSFPTPANKKGREGVRRAALAVRAAEPLAPPPACRILVAWTNEKKKKKKSFAYSRCCREGQGTTDFLCFRLSFFDERGEGTSERE